MDQNALPVVLVIEDDPDIQFFLEEALRDGGFEPAIAGSGEEAVTLLKAFRSKYTALITDIRLPGQMDGWQIAERCREHDPGLPVIYATGFSPIAPRPVPGSLCLRKPYHPKEILRAVRQVAAGSASKQ